MDNHCRVIAHSNIALIKYWGKRDSLLNLPAVGSISVTLDTLFTDTSVRFEPGRPADSVQLNNLQADEPERLRVSRFLDRIRLIYKEITGQILPGAEVITANNFPTAAGLASSASAFAALAYAGLKAAGLDLALREVSILARQGSGSAARSLFGGFVEMHRGQLPDGSDAFAEQILTETALNINVLILVTSRQKKKTGSTEGMNLTRDTSPYYQAWSDSAEADLAAMRQALQDADFTRIGHLAEFSCLKMHALAMSANPGIIYWSPATLHLLQQVREIRASGIEAYFTIDAGPQVKILCREKDAPALLQIFQNDSAVEEIIITRPGPGVRIVEP